MVVLHFSVQKSPGSFLVVFKEAGCVDQKFTIGVLRE